MVVESLRVNGTSSGIVSSTFIKLMVESGYKITVLTENNSTGAINWLPESVVVKKFEITTIQKSLLDSIPKFRAIPAYLTGFSKTFRNNINCYKEAIEKELQTKKFNSIYALGSGSSFAPHFALAEMNLSIPFFVNIHDPFPMHLYPEPYRKPKTWINSILEKKFKVVLDKAKGISFPSQLLMEDMAKTFPSINKKGFVIPHIGTFLDNLPTDNLPLIVVLDPTKINILHAGTLLGPRNPKFLLQAIEELNQENAEFLKKMTFTFIGGVSNELINIVDKAKLENVKFITARMSYQKSLDLIKQADASLVIEAISNFSPFLPGKVADIVYAEKPIIALSPKKSEVIRLLGVDYAYQSELQDVKNIKAVVYQFYIDAISNNINTKEIQKLKEYVSITVNSQIIKEHLN